MKGARVVLLSLALAATLASNVAWAATHVVKPDGSGDFATINDAIIEASDWDVIELANGAFRGEGNRDIYFEEKSLTIRSQGGAEACTLDCEGSAGEPHRGFRFYWCDDSTVVI